MSLLLLKYYKIVKRLYYQVAVYHNAAANCIIKLCYSNEELVPTSRLNVLCRKRKTNAALEKKKINNSNPFFTLLKSNCRETEQNNSATGDDGDI